MITAVLLDENQTSLIKKFLLEERDWETVAKTIMCCVVDFGSYFAICFT